MSSENYQISYSEMESLGIPSAFIEDYQSFKRAVSPQQGTTADPNGVFVSNLSQIYIDTSLNAFWFNPTVGSDTGWVQLTL